MPKGIQGLTVSLYCFQRLLYGFVLTINNLSNRTSHELLVKSRQHSSICTLVVSNTCNIGKSSLYCISIDYSKV